MTVEKRRLPIISFLKVFDLALMVLSFALTTAIVFGSGGELSLREFLAMRIRVVNGVIFILALVIFHIVFSACRLYWSRRLSSRRGESVDLLRATTLSAMCLLVLASIFTIRMITLPFLALFWLVSSAVLVSFRLLLRVSVARVRTHGRNLRYMLILGTNPRAVAFARKIAARPEHGYLLLGFVDNDWLGLSEFEASGFSLVSNCAGLAEFLRRNVVDEVAVYLPVASFYRRVFEVARLCEEHGIMMRFNSDIFGLKTARWRAEEFDGDHYIATYTGPDAVWPVAVKRVLDVMVSSAFLLALSPALAVVAVLIKLTSPGPIFFLQERIGLNKRRFKVYKFRTMVPNAETLMKKLEAMNEVSGPVFKIKNDPRITKIGRFLRRSSIDELPQFLNVLRGDMSLVGPRPLPVRDYEGFNQDWQRRRFSVKPGITCLWQVNGRSGISFDEWMLLDLQYMDEWSLWLDFKILAKTVPAVLKGEGAA